MWKCLSMLFLVSFLGGIVYMDLKEIELIIERIDEIREQLKEEIKK